MHASRCRLLLSVGLLAMCGESKAWAQSSAATAGTGRSAVKSTARPGGAPAAGAQKLPIKPQSAAISGKSADAGPTASLANLPGSSPAIFSALEALSKASSKSRPTATVSPTSASTPLAAVGNQSGNASPLITPPRLPVQRMASPQHNSYGARRSSSSHPRIEAFLNRHRSGPGNGPRRGFRRST